MTYIKVDVSDDTISIANDGHGIPTTLHKKEKVRSV